MGDGAIPYAPVVEALRGFVRHADAEEIEAVFGANRAELARLVPDLGPATVDTESRLSVQSAQGRLFELVLGALERLAMPRAVVFVVEDLHWSDRSTRDLLGFLIRNLRDARVTLVLTYRSDELHRRHPLLPFLAELERTGRVERIGLLPFDATEVAEQLRAIAGHDLSPGPAGLDPSPSGGNAFFAEELFAASGEDGAIELPQTLRDVLLAHVSDLAETTQEVLRIASAAGRRVDPTLVAEAAGLDEATLYDALRECVARQVLVFDPTADVERYASGMRCSRRRSTTISSPGSGRGSTRHSPARSRPGRPRQTTHVAELAYHWYAPTTCRAR
jgi:predicted ATPase